ncbi:MAG: nuclear transport factor 2 family protein [Glaciimonas sp.]|nr:nuclear transport factor 2 family protein [Glaciimonas sp.]
MNTDMRSNPGDDAKLHGMVQFFESLTAESVQHLDRVYATGASFKDPFNDVCGLPAIAHIFSHMFTQVDDARFVVTTQIVRGDTAFLTWDFLFRMKRFSTAQQCIRGATHLRFATDGRVNFHRDYWDAAEELYEKLPILGGFMRLLKRAVARDAE